MLRIDIDSESTEDGTATDESIGKTDQSRMKDEGSSATNELDEDSSDDSGVVK